MVGVGVEHKDIEWRCCGDDCDVFKWIGVLQIGAVTAGAAARFDDEVDLYNKLGL